MTFWLFFFINVYVSTNNRSRPLEIIRHVIITDR